MVSMEFMHKLRPSATFAKRDWWWPIGKWSDDYDGGHQLLALVIKSYWLTMIMSGDFNINFSTDEAQPVLRFMDEKAIEVNPDWRRSVYN